MAQYTGTKEHLIDCLTQSFLQIQALPDELILDCIYYICMTNQFDSNDFIITKSIIKEETMNTIDTFREELITYNDILAKEIKNNYSQSTTLNFEIISSAQYFDLLECADILKDVVKEMIEELTLTPLEGKLLISNLNDLRFRIKRSGIM